MATGLNKKELLLSLRSCDGSFHATRRTKFIVRNSTLKQEV